MRRPPKFSWVVEGLLAAQGRPTLPGHLQYLCDNNIKYIVTLTKTKPRALLDIPGLLKICVKFPLLLLLLFCFSYKVIILVTRTEVVFVVT